MTKKKVETKINGYEIKKKREKASGGGGGANLSSNTFKEILFFRENKRAKNLQSSETCAIFFSIVGTLKFMTNSLI